MLAAQNGREKVFEVFWSFVEKAFPDVLDQKALLEEEFDEIFNRLLGVGSRSSETPIKNFKGRFGFVTNLIEKIFGIERVKRFLNFDTILNHMKSGESESSIIWNFLTEKLFNSEELKILLLQEDQNGKKFLERSTEAGNFNPIGVCLPYLQKTYDVDLMLEMGVVDAVLDAQLRYGNVFPGNKDWIDQRIVKEILHAKTKDGKNIFHLSAADVETFKFFLEKLRAETDQVKEFLSATDHSGSNLLCGLFPSHQNFPIEHPNYIFPIESLVEVIKPIFGSDLFLLFSNADHAGANVVHQSLFLFRQNLP